jgi:hypothetical protein
MFPEVGRHCAGNAAMKVGLPMWSVMQKETVARVNKGGHWTQRLRVQNPAKAMDF